MSLTHKHMHLLQSNEYSTTLNCIRHYNSTEYFSILIFHFSVSVYILWSVSVHLTTVYSFICHMGHCCEWILLKSMSVNNRVKSQLPYNILTNIRLVFLSNQRQATFKISRLLFLLQCWNTANSNICCNKSQNTTHPELRDRQRMQCTMYRHIQVDSNKLKI